jgi:hypothetical protein
MMLIPLALALLVAGCIVTGNILVVIKLTEYDNTLLDPDHSFDVWLVNREDHQDWKDHADDINHVVDFGFSVTFDNSSSNVPANGEFYISMKGDLTAEDLYPDADTMGVYRIFSGLTVPAGDSRHVTWQQSYKYLQNFDKMKEYVMEGKFYLYVKDVDPNVYLYLRKPAVILTLNAKP